MAAVLFRLTIPRDVQLVPAVRQVAERVAQCAGYTASDAARIALTVGQAVEVVLTSASSDGGGREPIEIRFERESVHLDVWLRYRATEPERAPAVDPAVSSEAMRQGMDSVEFGREGELAYCRLRRELPREKTDHQCEAPPDAH